MSKDTHAPLEPELLKWSIPNFLRPLVPEAAMKILRRFKERRLVRDVPDGIEFSQSREDASASGAMSIVVAIHDAPAVVERCLASLEKYAPEAEVIVVNDGSRLRRTVDVIQGFLERNRWKIVQHETALGHSAACRAGAQIATRPYLCLLNSDTVVTPWCWRGIKEVFESDPQVGVAGPSTSASGTIQALPHANWCCHYWSDNQICAYAERLLHSSETETEDLPWAGGFAFFVRRTLWHQIGGFDPNLPDYGNEVEFCKRVTGKGYRIVWARNYYIHHLSEQSYGRKLGLAEIESRRRAAEQYLRRKYAVGESRRA